jgi:hypothetical protein
MEQGQRGRLAAPEVANPNLEEDEMQLQHDDDDPDQHHFGIFPEEFQFNNEWGHGGHEHDPEEVDAMEEVDEQEGHAERHLRIWNIRENLGGLYDIFLCLHLYVARQMKVVCLSQLLP